MVNRDLVDGVFATLYIKLEMRIVEMIWNVALLHWTQNKSYFFDTFEKEIFRLSFSIFHLTIYFLHWCVWSLIFFCIRFLLSINYAMALLRCPIFKKQNYRIDANIIHRFCKQNKKLFRTSGECWKYLPLIHYTPE